LDNIDIVLALRDQRSVQILLLLALYCLRGAKNPGAWTLAGLAVRQCIELGLHRKTAGDEVTMEKELKARIFWSCYYLDRGVSVALGRPPVSNLRVEAQRTLKDLTIICMRFYFLKRKDTALGISTLILLTHILHFLHMWF
jgi:hypothetical protein